MADNTKIRYFYQLIAGRWQTTLKLAAKREYVTHWCYYSLFKFMEVYRKHHEIHKGRGEKSCTKLC